MRGTGTHYPIEFLYFGEDPFKLNRSQKCFAPPKLQVTEENKVLHSLNAGKFFWNIQAKYLR